MMARLMCKDAPPAPADAQMLERMKTIGIEPCKRFDAAKLDAATQASLPKRALEKIGANKDIPGQMVDGWVVTKGLGVYGTDYMQGRRRPTATSFRCCGCIGRSRRHLRS